MTTSIHAFNNRESSQSGIGCRVADSLDTAEGFDRTCCVHTCLVQLERNWTDSNRSAGHKFLGVTQYEDALAHRHILTLTQLGHAKFSRHVGSVALVRASHSASRAPEHHVQLLQPLMRCRTYLRKYKRSANHINSGALVACLMECGELVSCGVVEVFVRRAWMTTRTLLLNTVGCATNPQSHHETTDLVATVTHGHTAVKKNLVHIFTCMPQNTRNDWSRPQVTEPVGPTRCVPLHQATPTLTLPACSRAVTSELSCCSVQDTWNRDNSTENSIEHPLTLTQSPRHRSPGRGSLFFIARNARVSACHGQEGLSQDRAISVRHAVGVLVELISAKP